MRGTIAGQDCAQAPAASVAVVLLLAAALHAMAAHAQADAPPITADLSRPPPSGYVRLQGRVRPVDPQRTKTMARSGFDAHFDVCNGTRQLLGAEPQSFSAAQLARVHELLDSFVVEEMYDERSRTARREFRQAFAYLNYDPKAAFASRTPPDCLAYRVARIDRTTIWHADGTTDEIAYDDDGRPRKARRSTSTPPKFMRLDASFARRTIVGETCIEVPVSAAVIFPKGRCVWERYAGWHEKNLPLPLESVHHVMGEEFHATAVEALAGLPDRWLGFDRLPEGAQQLIDHPPRQPARPVPEAARHAPEREPWPTDHDDDPPSPRRPR